MRTTVRQPRQPLKLRQNVTVLLQSGAELFHFFCLRNDVTVIVAGVGCTLQEHAKGVGVLHNITLVVVWLSVLTPTARCDARRLAAST